MSNLRTTLVGRAVTSAFCYVFETLRILPRGTYDTQQFLIRGADGLVAGGVSETFTPMFFFLCRKVNQKEGRMLFFCFSCGLLTILSQPEAGAGRSVTSTPSGRGRSRSKSAKKRTPASGRK